MCLLKWWVWCLLLITAAPFVEARASSAQDGLQIARHRRHRSEHSAPRTSDKDNVEDEDDTTPTLMRKRRPKRTVPHTTALSPLAVPSILTRTQEKVLKKRMKRQVETLAKTPTHGLKHKSSALELSTYSTPDQVRYDTAATERYGICATTLHLTACVERVSRNTVSCMTQFVPATSPPQCDVSFLREKQPSAVHNDKFYAVAGHGKIPPGIVIQDISETLTVHSLPPTHHLDFSNLKALVMENITIPEGVHTLRLANASLKGYPTNHFRNVTLAASMRRVALRHNLMTSFDPSDWARFPLVDLFLENNLLRSFVNATFPPTISTLNLRNNVLESFLNTTFPVALAVLRLEGNNLATVEALPVRHLTQLKRLELRSNPRITALTKASGDALPANLTSLDFTLCNIRHIDADFMLPPALTTLKLRNNKLSSILNLTLPATLQTLTLEGNVLTDARITQRNFDILVKCTRVSATVPAPECKGSEVQRMTPFKFELCVLPDTAQVLAAPLPKKSFVTSILPILGSALGGTVLLTAIFVFRFRRRANCRPKAMNQTLHDCPLERTAADGSTSPENDEHGSSPSSSAYSEGEERVGSDRSGNLCPRLHLQRCSDARCPSILQTNQWTAWAIPPEALNDIHTLAGRVRIAVCSNQRVALVSLRDTTSNTTRDLNRLFKALAATQDHPHPSVMACYGITWKPDAIESLALVTEFMAGGSLFDAIAEESIGDSMKLPMANAVAQALAHIHDNCHESVGHLSANCILLDGRGRAKLNLPRCMMGPSITSTQQGVWVPPEGSGTSMAADVYSFGVLLAVLDRGVIPDNSVPVRDLFAPTCLPHVRALGLACMDVQPQRRPTMAVVVSQLNLWTTDASMLSTSEFVSTVSTNRTFH
ncbi:serine/threonine protein kinase, variant 1 [Aphanomyces invadans]|uniref:Serine/threonine protein kinase, variant 1 n=1 Tax=Aphanomyces invadans TaxID=157072 RepID=A0A024UAB0_9STRA|nr:serine/threonine protein kinase, variant 1 [Aphanomyces invadans]ETW02548.1 serine/threonine protein kinase, variant 1 [Aphanomyces invadans]|eukprot:XP_008869153.1 serine/threonine protein kinase, variant 1 [Aphanomyces invadans]